MSVYCKQCGTKNENNAINCTHCQILLSKENCFEDVPLKSINNVIDSSTFIWAFISIVLNILLLLVSLFKSTDIIHFIFIILIIFWFVNFSFRKNKFLSMFSFFILCVNIFVYFLL